MRTRMRATLLTRLINDIIKHIHYVMMITIISFLFQIVQSSFFSHFSDALCFCSFV